MKGTTGMTDSQHSFGKNNLTATVSAHGAELISLRTASGQDLLWNAGPAWKRHSPVLFPIIGKPLEDTTLNGQPVTLPQHGFARDMTFRWLERTEAGCVLELKNTPKTWQLFPAAFRLHLIYRMEETGLHVGYVLTNPSEDATLHASLGAHPAFMWPLKPDTGRDAHRLTFEVNEADHIRRISPDGLLPKAVPSPIHERVLPLEDSLFEDDAIIMLDVHSKAVDFTGPDGSGLRVRWDGFKDLGIWTKPGAGFLCIEPWYGYATPVDFAGDFSEKPGLLHLQPGESWEAFWSVEPV
ncbi:aldose 1-epimerase family protein [Gluconobacter thailandicus]|uniref:Aldose 1-epimerase family protein n=2 Tax=Gluconobacter thailandicus TaxID=257438 RepID=A0AAP9JHN4_GLUTH|nr:aldose 1-epimerase family protein [Gluconobacter thailandicus]